MSLPKIAERRIEQQFEMLWQTIIDSNFPSGFRGGVYDQALEQLESWDEEKIKISEIYTNKKNPVMIALRFYKDDCLAFSRARRIAEENKNKKTPEIEKENPEQDSPSQ